MAPRVVRPRDDRAHWWLTGVCTAASLALGYWGGMKVFKPSAPAGASAEEGGGDGAGANAGAEEEASDAGAPGRAADEGDAGAVVAPVVPAAPAAPLVPVRVMNATLQSCGDGEELTIPGERCEPVPGLEEALRRRLNDLGSCPAALDGARTPDQRLSVGLRIDFQRHRVTALSGRSSNVRSPLTYLPCARAALARANELWRMQPPHPRYLYFFTVRFGPLPAGVVIPSADAGVAAVEPVAPANTDLVDAGSPPTAAVTPAPAPAPVPVPAPEPVPVPPAANNPAVAAPAPAPTGTPLSRPEAVTVVWPRALVRESPPDGAVVAHLREGAELRVIARQGRWWRVRFGEQTGWIYGEAIGR